MALTIETARPGGGVGRRLGRAGTSFWYANPDDPTPHLANDLPGCLAALAAGVA